jgi:hypothetical protein
MQAKEAKVSARKLIYLLFKNLGRAPQIFKVAFHVL